MFLRYESTKQAFLKRDLSSAQKCYATACCKKPKRFYRFVSFYQTVASYRAAPRYDFHSQVRKNHAEQPPQIAVKARLFITAKIKALSAHMRVSASEPQHFVYSRSLHAEFR